MKTLFILILTMAFGVCVNAQNVTKAESLKAAQNIQPGDSIIMKEGSVWLIKEGKRIVVTTETEMGGTKVKADGSVILKDGTVTTLQEGDVILASGKLVRALVKVRLDDSKNKNSQ